MEVHNIAMPNWVTPHMVETQKLIEEIVDDQPITFEDQFLTVTTHSTIPCFYKLS